MKNNNWHGIFNVMITPFDKYGDIDKPKDIHSIIISSINGHHLKESIQEIKKILEL